MKTRAFARLRGILVFLVTAASVTCGGDGPGTGPGDKPVVSGLSNGSTMVGQPYSLSATFSDSANQGPWSYEVSWGDGNQSTGTKSSTGAISATHTYASQGNYNVGVTVTNADGASGSDAASVAATAPVIVTAGDIADCARGGDEATANLLDNIPGTVMPLGDLVYLSGSAQEFTDCYAPNWGRQKSRSRPVPGNHDYYTAGAAGYFSYFGAAAGDPAKGYYDFVLGDWLVMVINTGTEKPVDYAVGSAQEQWIRAELASHTQQCVVALFHHPRFSTTSGRDLIRPEVTPIWNALYEYGVDLVLNAHDHNYQRWAPQKPDGTVDAAFGIRQITVGTGGGEGLYSVTQMIPPGANVEARASDTFGVLKVTLKSGGYDWQFIPATSAGGSFTDSGSGTCHGRPS